eukprot:TRINITY_DN4078_c0_g2_i1.p1 TRINITY_DN4078_c0_g2~~TRINITY_DN4078_c0_g2_i1.p1  ORF type:complete len:253 (-),score=46.60 TRINITY_DN4078_c0_g2_i1:31-762(-)
MPPFMSMWRPTFVAGGSLLGLNYLANSFGSRFLKAKVEAHDRLYLGTDITIGKCELNLRQGRVAFRDLRMLNPTGYGFKSPYIFNIGHVVFDIGVLHFLRHGDVKIDEFSLRDVEILIEAEDVWGPDVLFGKSNVGVVLDFLEDRSKKASGSEDGSEAQKIKPQLAEASTKKKRNIVLNKVNLENISATHSGASLVLGNISYVDFTEETGDYTMDDLLAFFAKTILNTAKANVTNISAPFRSE